MCWRFFLFPLVISASLGKPCCYAFCRAMNWQAYLFGSNEQVCETSETLIFQDALSIVINDAFWPPWLEALMINRLNTSGLNTVKPLEHHFDKIVICFVFQLVMVGPGPWRSSVWAEVSRPRRSTLDLLSNSSRRPWNKTIVLVSASTP